MIGSVDFSGHEEMYDELVIEMDKPENAKKKKYLIFDEPNQTVWFCWCEENLLR